MKRSPVILYLLSVLLLSPPGVAEVQTPKASSLSAGNMDKAEQSGVWINVKAFGAKGDGVSDDRAAIQAAIAYALSTPHNGGTIIFPDGQYRVSAPLHINGSGITLQGGNASSTRFVTTSNTANIIEIGANSSVNEGIRIMGLGFAAAEPQTAGTAIYIHNAVNLLIQNIRVLDNIYNGIDIEGRTGATFGVHISHFDLKLIRNIGIVIGADVGATDVFLQDGSIRPGSMQSRAAIQIIQGYGVYAQNIDITNFDKFYFKHGIDISPNGGQQSNAIMFNQVLSDSSSGHNLIIGGAGKLSDIQIVGSWFNTSSEGHGVVLENKNIDGLSIDNSTINANCGYGVLLNNGKNISVSGNKILSNGRCRNNPHLRGSVFIRSGLSNFSITNNQIGVGGYFNNISASGSAQYGIWIDKGQSDDYIISLNRGFGNKVGMLNDQAKGHHAYVSGNVEMKQ